MRVTADVECTPEEARVFFGLPNVQPLQTAITRHMEDRIIAEMDRFSPEKIFNNWLSSFGLKSQQISDNFIDLFAKNINKAQKNE